MASYEVDDIVRVITDYSLPEMSGIELVIITDLNRNTPAILMTGSENTDIDNRLEAAELRD